MKHTSKIPVFISGHPLRLESRLRLNGYDAMATFNATRLHENTICISWSLLELIPFIDLLKQANVKQVSIVAFANPYEMKLCKDNNLLSVRVYERFLIDFVPRPILLDQIDIRKYPSDLLMELHMNINFAKSLLGLYA